MTAAADAPAPEPEPRDYVRYAFHRVPPDWRREPADVRRRGIDEFCTVLDEAADPLRIRTYSTLGLKADADFLIWSIAPALEPLQRLHARLLGTPLGGRLQTPYTYLGMGRRSEYLGTHEHGGEGASGRRSFGDKPYLFVYPFVKKREWYQLPFEERRRIMGEHIRRGHRYPDVEIHTGYSFGLDDMEFILSFGADDPARFLDLVQELRGSEASRYTALETPIFTCVRVAPRAMLEWAVGTP